MALDRVEKARLEALFAPVGPILVKAMFGGIGLFAEGPDGPVMFALVAEGTLYLKADDTSRPAFEAAGMGPFVYEGKGRRVTMSYWEMPEALYDDEDALKDWAGRAIAIARAAARPRRSKGR